MPNRRAADSTPAPPDPQRYRNPDEDARGPWMATDLTVLGRRPGWAYVFHSFAPPEGRSWRYTQARMAALEAEGRIVLRPTSRPVLKRYFADAAGSPEPVVDEPEAPEAPASGAVGLIRGLSKDLARLLARVPAELAQLRWFHVEELLGEVCDGLGFETRVTRPSQDGGFDIALSADGLDYLIEVKHWTAPNRVGGDKLTHFADVVLRAGVERGLFLSTSGFRRVVMQARLEVTPDRVALADGRKVIALCQRYVALSDGIWRPETPLAELLFEDTF